MNQFLKRVGKPFRNPPGLCFAYCVVSIALLSSSTFLLAAPGDEQWDDRFGSTTNLQGTIAVYRNEVYATSYKWNGSSLEVWGPQLGTYWAMAANETELFVGGRIFDRTFGPGVSHWDGTQWNKMGTGITISDYGPSLRSLALKGSDVFAGGSFGLPASGVRRWDGTNWLALGTGLEESDSPGSLALGALALAVKENILYVGGRFDLAGGLSIYNLAKWDGTNWSAVDASVFGPDSPDVTGLGVNGPDLYIGTHSVRKWNGSTFTTLGNADGAIWKFAFTGNEVYIGGDFSSVDGVQANHIARWDGTNWSSLGSGITGQSPEILGLVIWKNDVIVSGFFDAAGGKPSRNFAIWHRVALECATSAGAMQLAWPTFATNYVLESNTGMSPTGWRAVSPPPTTNHYTVPSPATGQFFRLHQR